MDYKHQDSLHVGPFFRDLPGGADVGYLRNGTAWYRKTFVSPPNKKNKQILLNFDGVQSQMELWVNGIMVGEHLYGYTPFYFDITPALNEPGESNIVAVKTVNPGENSRWFAGAGIYRPVQISMLHPVSVVPWGVKVTTPEVSDQYATVQFEIEVNNHLPSETELKGEILILAPDRKQVKILTEEFTIGAESNVTLRASTRMDDPMLWSVDHPALCSAEVIIYSGGKKVDSYHTSFGIRSIAYSAEKGLLLNGEEILMKGACLHHDNGLLGAAAFRDAEYRRVKRMKENGYNAIRTSHNPPSEAFLEACDELGMLVIDESFDHWLKAKLPNDYSNYFEEWHVKDVQSMVFRDRNHPSVVMWSFGNEVQERADPGGIEIGKALAAAIREVDDTRPVTQAVCGFWDNPGKEWDYSAGAFSMLDIGGYNYQFLNYEVVGVTDIDSLDKYVARFTVPYEAGELRAVGMQKGEEMEDEVLRTAGPASQLFLIPEQKAFKALDQEGLEVADNDAEVRVHVSGPALLQSAGNANPEHRLVYQDFHKNMKYGY
jgi:beta-galactosidase